MLHYGGSAAISNRKTARQYRTRIELVEQNPESATEADGPNKNDDTVALLHD